MSTTCPFTIDIDPVATLDAANGLAALAHDLNQEMLTLSSRMRDLGGFWQGESADAVRYQVNQVVGRMTATTQRLDEGQRAVAALAHAMDQAVTGTAGCVSAWENATYSYDRLVAAAAASHRLDTANALTPAQITQADTDHQNALHSAQDQLAADQRRGASTFRDVEQDLATAVRGAARALAAAVPEGYVNWKRDISNTLGLTSGGASLLLAPAEAKALVGLSNAVLLARASKGETAVQIADDTRIILGQLAHGNLTRQQAEAMLDQSARDAAKSSLSSGADIERSLAGAGEEGGLGGSGLASTLGKGAGILAVAGDVSVLVDPGATGTQAEMNRGAAIANIGGTAMTVAPAAAAALGLDATVGWVPVAGQVVVLASGVYLAYEGIKPVHDAVNDAASSLSDAATTTVHAIGTAGTAVAHAAATVGTAVVNAPGAALHDVEGWLP